MTTRCRSSASTPASSRSLARAFAALFAAALVASCAPPGGSDPGGASPPASDGSDSGAPADMAEAGALFSASAADPSLIRFTTGDEAYITDRGYTLWALKAPAQNPFSERRVILNKSSGSPEAGYGVVFCHHASDERMLVAMIDVQGEYIVGEALGSTFTPIVPWTSSAHLKRGYNQDNELLLRLEGGSRSFSLSLNGAEVESFSAIEPEYEPGGGNGYLVVVSPLDRFPASPVGASFRER